MMILLFQILCVFGVKLLGRYSFFLPSVCFTDVVICNIETDSLHHLLVVIAILYVIFLQRAQLACVMTLKCV